MLMPSHKQASLVLFIGVMCTGSLAQAQGFPASINLSDIDGSNGFVIKGVSPIDDVGRSVSNVGDVNGDGIDDIVIGAPASPASANGINDTGDSYVVFGGAGIAGSLELSNLDGSNGYVIRGINAVDFSGKSVSGAGDVNGDGVNDLIIGAPAAEPMSEPGIGNVTGDRNGQAYVIFGGADTGSEGALELSDLNGSNGFIISGLDAFDSFGDSVSSAGDFNDDGFDDVMIGAPQAGPNGRDQSGETYVLFGSSNIGNSGVLELTSLNGSTGFVINGIAEDDGSGSSVSSAGDINDDGVNDIIIGAKQADPDGNKNAGQSYVIFGGPSVGSGGSLELMNLDGSNGFVVNGAQAFSFSGTSVSDVGDLNIDGIDDVIIGAPRFQQTVGRSAGASYVIFGRANVGANGLLELSSLNGLNGFVINGVGNLKEAGRSVSAAGDVNGDGIDDAIIGAPLVRSEDSVTVGESYVVFGDTDIGSTGTLELSRLDGSNGFTIKGTDTHFNSGLSVSGAGDINADGVSDVITGAPTPRLETGSQAGASFVIFGIANLPPIPPGLGPDNDQFANTTWLDGVNQALASDSTFTISGTTIEATAQALEPAHNGRISVQLPGPRNSVWYSFTATATQVIEVDTVGSDVPTLLVAYTGATLPGLQAVARAINNERDVARIRFLARADVTYHFVIDGYTANSQGNIQLNVRRPVMDPEECTITGTEGADELTGTRGPDIICALGGDDKIKSLGGPDIIFAGSGNDLVSAGGGNDLVFGEDGRDRLVGRAGDDVLDGGQLGDRLYGGKGNDVVFGSSGADRLFGAEGDDELFGGTGGDRLFGGPGDDELDGGPFNDMCIGSTGFDTLVGC